jgi:hypothetical protein
MKEISYNFSAYFKSLYSSLKIAITIQTCWLRDGNGVELSVAGTAIHVAVV